MTIHEPMTAITDVLVTVVCWAPLLLQKGTSRTQKNLNWNMFYFFLGASTLLGAFIHAFLPNHDSLYYLTTWLLMQLVSGLATYAAERATIISFGFPRQWLLYCQVKFAAFAIAVVCVQHFSVVLANNIIGILPVLFIHLLHPQRTKNHTQIGLRLVIQCVAGLVFALKISPHVDFDHKALAHVVMAIGCLPPTTPKEG